jgi:hypothetical protein
MKNVKLIFSVSIVLLSFTISAQNNMGMGMNGNRNGSMMGNGAATTNSTEFQNSRRKAEMEKEKEKSIERSIAKLKADLGLDALQEIAVKQILEESVRIEGIIMKKEESDEEKLKALKGHSETVDIKIKSFLTKEQIEKFLALKEDLNNKKRKK